jgi:hypothetical protein
MWVLECDGDLFQGDFTSQSGLMIWKLTHRREKALADAWLKAYCWKNEKSARERRRWYEAVLLRFSRLILDLGNPFHGINNKSVSRKHIIISVAENPESAAVRMTQGLAVLTGTDESRLSF